MACITMGSSPRATRVQDFEVYISAVRTYQMQLPRGQLLAMARRSETAILSSPVGITN